MPTKVRLLSTYDNNPPNTILTLPDAVANQLLAGNVGATLDLTGGVTRFQDASAAVSGSQIASNRRATIAVSADQALRVAGSLSSSGTLETLDSNGNVVSTRPLTSAGSGLLPGGRTYRITSTYGTFTTTLQDNEVAYDPAPRFDIPVKVATWGDSLADTSNAATHDLTRADSALWDGKDLFANRLAANLLQQSGGQLVPVANCGLGGTRSSGGATDILNRDLAAPGVNRRGAQDAANLGAKICILSLGRNNILQDVRANTSASAVQATLNTIYEDVVTAVKRVQRLGMYPILREFAGYGYEDSAANYAKGAGFTIADVEAQKAAINTAARYIRDVIVPTLGEMYLLPVREGMVDATGTWFPQYTIDGLHENRNGAIVIAQRVIDFVLSRSRPYTKTGPYAPLPDDAARVNAFANAAATTYTTPGSRLAGYSPSGAGLGAVTGTFSVTEEADGTVWQNFTCVATAFDGTPRILAPAGLASLGLYASMSVFGATPTLSVKAGDLVRVEYDYIIDDGNGGIPLNVLSWYAQISIGIGGGQFFRVRPMEQNNSNIGCAVPDSVIRGKMISPPIVMPLDSSALDNGLVQTWVYLSDNKPARIRMANPRFVPCAY